VRLLLTLYESLHTHDPVFEIGVLCVRTQNVDHLMTQAFLKQEDFRDEDEMGGV